MLLNKMKGRRMSALGLCLAFAFAPLFNAMADEPEAIPTDSSATTGQQPTALLQPLEQSRATAVMAGLVTLTDDAVASTRSALEAALPAGYKPVYMNQLAALYAAREQKPMWENREAVKAFQQQLAEVAIAGFQPQFTAWVELLTDPGVSGMARDLVLSDAMMGYLQFIAAIPVKGNSWLYSAKPYALATPPLSVINQWQLALEKANCPHSLRSLRRNTNSTPPCTARCWRWWRIPSPGRN